MRIADSEAQSAGLTQDHVRIKQQYGGGYPGNLEGLHHLHCLNLVRQGLVYNYEYYKEQAKGAFVNDEPVVKAHISKFLLAPALIPFNLFLVLSASCYTPFRNLIHSSC